ncbi:MAG: Glutathione import ATP-binding protein GsiA [Gammaproteobacteria bacterium]|nr:Glutathione import ATP-binding protein GsiA [Gammaproteobacteria bacterium]
MTNNVLRIEDLRMYLGGAEMPVRAVDGINLKINEGETLALLGESGCGKSMTALSLMRLLPSSGRVKQGRVLYMGQDLLTLAEMDMRRIRGSGISMIFQEPMTSLNAVLTVGEQIRESLLTHQGVKGAGARKQSVDLLRSVGIPSPERRIDEYPHQLSGGMKQRVMIAIALANEPELLIADEPTTAVDVTIQAQVLALIRRLQKERGMAVLLITHDLGVVSEVADRVAVMYAGQIIEQAGRESFFGDPKHPYSGKLFESLPALNKRDQPLYVIKGFVPSLRTDFKGCRFASRCDYVMPVCREKTPAMINVDGGQVACYLYSPDHAPEPVRLVESVEPVSGRKMGSEEELLDVTGLKVYFPIKAGVFKRTVGHVYAVDGVDINIPTGRTLALVGESGSGKTTAGKGILQLIAPTGGRVRFQGEDLTAVSASSLRHRRTEFQIIFQDPFASMNPRMLVRDIIAEGLRAQHIGGPDARRRRVVELLEMVGLQEDSADRYPHEFSGGQRQRICIARALAVRPKLIVCDEPTSALDVSVQAQILNLLRNLQDKLGLSYLFITHNMSVVAYLAHEVAVMYLGRIVEQGPVETVLTQPSHPYTKALLSAVPTIETGAQHSAIRLEGDMPSPSEPPKGCYFHPRCPEAITVCRERYPGRASLNSSHSASCHLLSGGD